MGPGTRPPYPTPRWPRRPPAPPPPPPPTPSPAVARENGPGTTPLVPAPARAPPPAGAPAAPPVDPFAAVSPTAPAAHTGRAAGGGAINVFGEIDGPAGTPTGDGQDGRFQ